MASERELHTATLLHDGRVLMAGGTDGPKDLASAELYDPKTGTFEATGSMTDPRTSPASALLLNGEVLIVGGTAVLAGQPDITDFASAELYDPASGTFKPTGSMNADRGVPTATLLQDGRVLVVGGMGGSDGASAELYWP
jgi:hypothetical protein